MKILWTEHRFSGGALALDAANTVVHRLDPARRFDRFADAAEIARFAEAASTFRRAELGASLTVDDPAAAAPSVIALREATDALLRPFAAGDGVEAVRLARFTRACAAALENSGEGLLSPVPPFSPNGQPLRFEAALALSALSLLAPERLHRLKICENCHWLFLDRSRNRSRLWCDMAVCGNRAKARRYHLRRRIAGAASHAR